MSLRSWLYVCAIGWCLTGSAYAQSVRDDTSTQTGPANNAAEEPGQNLGPALSGIQDSIDSLTSAVEASLTNPEAEAEKNRAAQDLQAQKDMAKWAKWMFIATAVAVVLTGVGVGLLWKTLTYTRDTVGHTKGMLDEAKKTTAAALAGTEATQKMLESQLRAERAYVHIGVDAPGIEVLSEEPPRVDRLKTRLSINNAGATPAILTRFYAVPAITPVGMAPEPIDPRTQGGRGLPAGIIVTRDRPWLDEGVRVDRLTIADKQILDRSRWIWVHGFVRYQDIFETNHIVGFAMFYDPKGRRFNFVGEGTKHNYSREEDPAEIPAPTPFGT